MRLIAIRAAKPTATSVQWVRRLAAGASTTTSPIAVTDAAIAWPDGNAADSVLTSEPSGRGRSRAAFSGPMHSSDVTTAAANAAELQPAACPREGADHDEPQRHHHQRAADHAEDAPDPIQRRRSQRRSSSRATVVDALDRRLTGIDGDQRT